MATEAPREKLKELVEKNGDSLLQDRDRCEGLLRDYCGVHRREISALVGALEERVAVELRSPWQTAMTPEAMRARLVQRLEDNRGLAPEIADYAVDTWSYALGVGLERSSDRVVDVIAASQNGAAGSAPASAPMVTPVAANGGMSNQHKAVAGGVGLLAAVAVALALLHHPQAPATPSPKVSPVQDGQSKVPPAQNAQIETKPGGTQGNGLNAPQAKPSVVPAGTSVVVRLDNDFNSDTSRVGQMLPATVVTPLTSEGKVVVHRGASAQLRVVRIDKSDEISGKSHVEFALVGLTSHGKLMHISGSSKAVDGPLQEVKTAEKTGIGSAAGAAIGSVAGHLFRRTGSSGTTGGPTSHPAPVKMSAETVLQFHLTRSIPLGS